MDLTGATDLAGFSARWGLASVSSLAWQELDSEFVVYLEDFGSTHLLNSYAGAILLTLLEEARPLTANEVFESLNATVEESEWQASDDSAGISQVLMEFARVGLIRQY